MSIQGGAAGGQQGPAGAPLRGFLSLLFPSSATRRLREALVRSGTWVAARARQQPRAQRVLPVAAAAAVVGAAAIETYAAPIG